MLSLEACFNTLHKINFKVTLIPSLESSLGIPQETIGRRRSQAETHAVLSKKLISDISNINKLPEATTHADATNRNERQRINEHASK